MGGKKGPGGYAAIHAARARKLRAQMGRVRDALIGAGFPADDEDDEAVAAAVEQMAAALREATRKLEDIEWEQAGRS